MAELDKKKTVTLEELMVSTLAMVDAVMKPRKENLSGVQGAFQKAGHFLSSISFWISG